MNLTDQLADKERQIRQEWTGLESKERNIGRLLKQISKERLYRARKFKSFEEYLKGGGLPFQRARAYELMSAATTIDDLAEEAPDLPPVTKPTTVRAIAKFPKKQKAAVYRAATRSNKGKAPTQKQVETALKKNPFHRPLFDSSKPKESAAVLPTCSVVVYLFHHTSGSIQKKLGIWQGDTFLAGVKQDGHRRTPYNTSPMLLTIYTDFQSAKAMLIDYMQEAVDDAITNLTEAKELTEQDLP